MLYVRWKRPSCFSRRIFGGRRAEEWLIEEEDDVEVGQKLALIRLSNGVAESEPENTTRFVLKVHRGLSREAREQLQAVIEPP